MRYGGYQLPFFKRKPFRLTFIDQSNGEDFIKETNISDDDMTVIVLSKAGYGSLEYLKNLDTPEFLDLVEFEHITRAIDHHIANRGT